MGGEPTLEDAILLATTLHRGQVDKAGAPYILHPLRVMLDPIITSESERIVAVLHDVMEDCDITFEKLVEMGYSEEVVDALRFLTKLPEEEGKYFDFIGRINAGPVLARRVKIADLRDNSNLSRIPNPTEADYARQKKYLRALQILQGSAPPIVSG